MSYAAWSVVFGEQPSAAKWNILGSNDAAFNDGTGLPSADADAATVATSQGTTSTTYTDLATTGPAVTIVVGATGLMLVGIGCSQVNNIQDNINHMSFALSGSNTLAAADENAVADRSNLASNGNVIGRTFLLEGLTPGSTTVTAKYKTNANTGTFADRKIWAVPL